MTVVDRYPILLCVATDERSGFAQRAEAGIALTNDESRRLGFAPTLQDVVLLPVADITAAQLEQVFSGDQRALRDVARLGMSEEVYQPESTGEVKEELWLTG